MDIYAKIRKLHEGEENEFTATVPVEFYITPSENTFFEDAECNVSFSLDVEYRNWGIKEINIQLVPIMVSVDAKDNEDVDYHFEVDVSKIKKEWEKGSGYTCGMMTLYLIKNESSYDIDYDKSSIVVYYLEKE